MAYKGGALVQPVQVDYGSVAKIYSAGMARVQEIREGVIKERGEQSAALAKASDYAVTGLQDMDNMYMKAGQLARTRMQELIAMNDRGEISRSELTAAFARETSEASILSKMPEIMKKNIDEIDKDDNLSSLTKDQLTNVYLNGVNTRGSYVDGSGMRKDLKHTIDIQQIGGQKYMVGNYEIYNPTTKEIEIKRVIKPLKDSVNPDYVKWEKIDDDHTVKKINNFSNMLGKRKFIDPNGDPIEFGLLQRLQDTNTYVRKENLDVFKNTVETHINSQDEKFWEAYAYEQMQVRAPWQSGYSGPLEQSKLDGLFKNQYQDKDGNIINVEEKDDVLGFKFDEKGDISLKDETLKLAKAHYRQKVYSSLQIDQERMNLSQEELDKQEVGGNDISKYNYVKNGNIEQPVRYDRDFFRSNLVNESLRKAKFQDQAIPINVEQFEYEMAKNGYSDLFEGANIDLNFEKIISNSNAEFSGFNIPGQVKKSSKKLNDFLNVTSSTGLKYDNINGIVVVTGIEGNPQVFVSGNAVATKQRSKAEFADPKQKKQGGKDSNVTRDETINVTNALSKPLSPGQITKLYEQIRNYPAFQEFLNSDTADPGFRKPEKAFEAIVEFAESFYIKKKTPTTP